MKCHLVGGGSEGEGLLQRVPHVEAQLEVLLHVLQRLVGREPPVYDGPTWAGEHMSALAAYVYFIGTCQVLTWTVLLKFIMMIRIKGY